MGKWLFPVPTAIFFPTKVLFVLEPSEKGDGTTFICVSPVQMFEELLKNIRQS